MKINEPIAIVGMGGVLAPSLAEPSPKSTAGKWVITSH
jgi:hypothetical protein